MNDFKICRNDELLQPAAEGEIVVRTFGGYAVYGWTHTIHSPSRGHHYPMRLFVSSHTFRWAAKRALAKWVEIHRWPIDNENAIEGIREWKP